MAPSVTPMPSPRARWLVLDAFDAWPVAAGGETEINVEVIVEATRRVEVLSADLLPVDIVPEEPLDPCEDVPELGLLPEFWLLTAGLATAEDTDGDKSSLLPAELQHVPLPVASQQNPPFGNTEF